jgi:SAM-dependent methyltransferase
VNARLFNLDKEKVELTDNGVFYVLSEEKITESYVGPSPSYHTWLRDEIELINRLDKIIEKYPNSVQWQDYNKIVCSKIMDVGRWKQLKDELLENIDVESGKVKNYRYWNNLRTELKVAECKQCLMQLTSGDIRKISEDKFDTYANVYDEIVGKPCLENFVKNYIKFIDEKFGIDFAKSEILSIGCGTGLTEKYIIDTYNVPKNNLLGIDISDSMVKIAARRINAKKEDITRLVFKKKYDIVFSGLNVLQYINSDDFRNAILNAGKATKSKGVFFGDFIAPDHIRWYPNVLITENVISLREPSLIEVNNHSYQSSEIINLNKLNNTIQISYEGIHKRYLPPIMRVYSIFKEAFGGEVQIFDAISLEKIEKNEDTCPSTRYLVVAQKS